ncbi:MAG: NUDIX domain-containing protein [Chloroflexi bacterium]|nr:NUDIX domain-containing protein [Chloroflexota bacterium]
MEASGKDTARFNFRVAGVAIHNGRVLLDRNTRNTYWVFPGGHPEIMEPLTEALRREVLEEIGEEVEIGRLLWVLENFFYKGRDVHELSFYFMIHLSPDSPLLQGDGPFYGQEHDQQLIYQWFPIDEKTLHELPLFPSPLVDALVNLSDTTQHIVFHDTNEPKNQPVKG